MEAGRGDILAVVGMTREAKILPGAPVLVGGGAAASLAGALEVELTHRPAGVVSFGLCGALDPHLKVGDLVIARGVISGDDYIEADRDWAARLVQLLPNVKLGDFTGAERPVAQPCEKAEMRERTGADVVDMESAIVARAARWFGAPFAVVRAVSDAAHTALPHAAQVGLGPDGRPALGAVLGSLRANPWQFGSLIRTALEAEDAFHALERARHLLGPRLAGPEAA
jgi:adenosylhomocysteine nucleosidase